MKNNNGWFISNFVFNAKPKAFSRLGTKLQNSFKDKNQQKKRKSSIASKTRI